MDVAPDTQELQARVADGVEQHKPFALQCRPLAATVGLYNGHVIVDPTAQEEGIMGSAVTVIADEEGRLHGALCMTGFMAQAHAQPANWVCMCDHNSARFAPASSSRSAADSDVFISFDKCGATCMISGRKVLNRVQVCMRLATPR